MESERRLHPFSFLFAIADTARQVLFPALFAVFATRNQDGWEIAAVFVLVPLAAIAFGRALSFRYRFDAAELVVRHGFVFRRVRHIPYDRIQNINVIQGPIHRLLSVVEVRIGTGGGAEVEAHMRVVNQSALDEIRQHVASRRGAAVAATPEGPDATTLLRLPPREVLLLGLIQGRGMVVLGALFGLLYELGIFDKVMGRGGAGRGFVRRLTRAVFDEGQWPVEQAGLALAAGIGVLVIFRMLSALWTAITFYGFTLQQVGGDLRCEYGLITRVTSTIPLSRIQKLTVFDGPWHRLGGRVSLHVQTAGGGAGAQSESGQRWLAPLVRLESLPTILANVLPDAAREVEWKGVHPRAVRRELVRQLIVLVPIIAVATAAAGWPSLAAAPVVLAWAVINARRTAAALKWSLSDAAVHFSSGWMWHTRVVAPLTKIQVVERRETPFDRRHGMASVVADTAGGHGPRQNAVHIPYLPRPEAADLSAQLGAVAAQTEFRL